MTARASRAIDEWAGCKYFERGREDAGPVLRVPCARAAWFCYVMGLMAWPRQNSDLAAHTAAHWGGYV